ncbi:unnamed protein product [Leptidea sinapis]|uniref:Peptidase M14 domain-containing protein n=1 Tax=Leptidea sinapis TaxID=189913 RepID=A0A5E4PMS6_9NEOP|nr:unnamed protein product [Leptidea sinapis]
MINAPSVRGLFRRKRAYTEYTRWYANAETTQEFIVNVLEDDMTNPKIKPIVAVNIEPIKKAEEKIIIGATLPTTETTNDLFADYTRFIIPTPIVSRYGDPVLTSVSHKNLPPVKPKLRKGEQQIGPIKTYGGDRTHHDESPPAVPKFISRSNSRLIQQYAPLASVKFTKQTSLGPLTPRNEKKFVLHRTQKFPTRTSLIYTNAQDDTSTDNVYLSRTSLTPTTLKSNFIDDDDDDVNFQITKDTYSSDYTTAHKQRFDLKTASDSDSSYNDIEDEDNNIEGTSVKIKTDVLANEYEFDGTSQFNIGKSEIEQSMIPTTAADVDTPVNDKDDEYENENENEMKSLSIQFPEIIAPSKSEEVKRNKTKCNLNKIRPFSFNRPRTLHEITSQLLHWAEVSPVAKLVDITYSNYTVMENPIYMMLVDDLSRGQIISAKQTVMIVAGIQGRDHHAVSAALYLLYQLIDKSDSHTDLLTKYRFWIIPVFNPDGYDYSMTFPKRREWAKNLRQDWDSCKGRDSCNDCSLYGLRCTIHACYGVNLDRNFEYQWIPHEELRSEHACGGLYSGARQLSEAETRAFTQFLHEQKTPLYTFIAFKEGDVLGVMYPYSHTKKKRAFDHIYRQRALRAAAAAYSISSRPYVAGQTSEFLPLYAGGIEDWVDGHLGIDNTYTRVVHEAYAAVHTLLLENVEPLGPPPVVLTRAHGSIRTYSINVILLPFCFTFILKY